MASGRLRRTLALARRPQLDGLKLFARACVKRRNRESTLSTLLLESGCVKITSACMILPASPALTLRLATRFFLAGQSRERRTSTESWLSLVASTRLLLHEGKNGRGMVNPPPCPFHQFKRRKL